MSFPQSNMITADYPSGRQSFNPSFPAPSDLQSAVNNGALAKISGGPQLVSFMGDSIPANSVASLFTGNVYGYSSIGFATWAMALSNGALWCPAVGVVGRDGTILNYNRAISGETAEQCLARITELDALPIKPKFGGISVGTNNLTLNLTQSAASIVSVIYAIIQGHLQRGIIPVVTTILPRGNGSASGWGGLSAGNITIQRGKLLEVNRQLRAMAGIVPGMILVDWYPVILNYASATSDPLVGYAPDYLHPNAAGAIRLGQFWWNAVAPYITPATQFGAGTGDSYDATNNYFGNLIDSSWSAGGGTADTGTSGTVPANWTAGLFEGAASTAVIARQVRADGNPGNEVTITMTGADAGGFRLYEGSSAPTAGYFVAGDIIYGESDVNFVGTGANQRCNPDYTMWVTGGGFIYAAYNTGTQGDIQGTYAMKLRTPLMVMPAGVVVTNAWSIDRINNGGSAVVTRRNLGIKKYNRNAFGALPITL